MIVISQRDPQWAQIKLGNSPLTVGRFGCTTSCISMIADYFKCYKNPIEIQDFIKYTPDGLVIWESFHLGQMKFEKRLRTRNDAEIQKSLNDPKKAVILEVDNCHWVVALGKIPFTNIYRIADPWTGTKRTTLAYRNITGSSHFFVR